ncbi:MAG: ABC transporter ATP-binding protein [Rivularia sp. (in: cyanobacteria)]
MFLAVVNVIAALASLLVIPLIADELLANQTNVQYIWQLVGISAITVIIAFISRVWAFGVSHMAAFKLEEIIRTQISEHLACLPLGFVITLGSGTIKKIIQDDVKQLHFFVADSTPLYARGYSAPNDGNPALSQINCYMASGTVTALVGTSGAGKSTVAKLIPRFWDVNQGAIKIGDVDVREMTSETLMNHVSFVFQDTFLLYDTIKENIRLGCPHATDAEVEAAAIAAQAHDFILELPQGYDTIAGDRGTRLSGGQRQRITIARAILQDNPIVILDEATAFTDSENEALIQAAIAKLTAGKTLVVIAHRLSTIVDADQIIVLDQGKIVESGTHEKLATNDGVYASLWNNYQRAQNWKLKSFNSY